VPELVVPSNIPWKELKGEPLEQFVYWLLDDMGARDLEWRRGGEKATSADGGRDLEASFHLESPDGSIDPQRWWIQVKGRSKTVEPAALQETILAVTNRSSVDVLVIVTNTQFSNPSRDWVAQWQSHHPRPKIRLWDRDTLERMVLKHPSVIAKACPSALSLQGRVEALRSRFWNQLYFATRQDLEELWHKRDDVNWSASSLLSVVAAELRNGDPRLRPWLGDLEAMALAEVIALALVNHVYLAYRAEQFGIAAETIEELAAYVVSIGLSRLPSGMLTPIVENPWRVTDQEEVPLEVRHYLHEAVLTRIQGELSDACAKDCARVVMCDPAIDRTICIDETYWHRFSAEPTYVPSPGSGRRLTLEKKDEPCKVGFAVDRERGCPLLGSQKASVTERMDILRQVIRVRTQELEH
jgi:hypothetical protein